MSLNCNEINLALSELDLAGSFIQDIIQPGFDTLALYTYKNSNAKTVLICTKPNACRINETNRKIPRNEKPLRFMEFLRSKIRGCKILSCEQIGLERYIKMELSHGIDSPEQFDMYIRLWSNAGNIILCDKNNTILDTMYRRPGKGEITGGTFTPPKAKDTSEVLPTVAQSSQPQRSTPDASAVQPTVAQSSQPPRSTPDASAAQPTTAQSSQPQRSSPDASAVQPTTAQSSQPPRSTPDTSAVQPTTARTWPIRDFAEIQAEHSAKYPQSKPLTFNQKIDIWYGEHAQSLSRQALLEQAEKWYNARKSRQENALNRLITKQTNFKNSAKLKHQGDLIMSFGYLIDGKSNFLDCEDYETGNQIRIKIDPTKSAHENAAVYYNNYKKESSGAEQLEHEIALAKKSIAALDNAYQTILNEKNPVKIEQLLRHDSKPKQQEKKTHPGLDYTVDGWYILVGRDVNENDDLLRHYVKGPDLWMHTRDYPGGYVFIKNRPNKTVPLNILLIAGNLAVYYSKARKAGKADLYYTHVKHLRRAKNAPKGVVLPTQEKNLTIQLDPAILHKLDELKADEEF